MVAFINSAISNLLVYSVCLHKHVQHACISFLILSLGNISKRKIAGLMVIYILKLDRSCHMFLHKVHTNLDSTTVHYSTHFPTLDIASHFNPCQCVQQSCFDFSFG